MIGNIDDDEELEIVVGGYESPTSTSPLFAINHDGSDVEGFPYIVGEKIKAGVAIADMDDNGIDDIIFGTDSDNLHVLLDDLTYDQNFLFIESGSSTSVKLSFIFCLTKSLNLDRSTMNIFKYPK